MSVKIFMGPMECDPESATFSSHKTEEFFFEVEVPQDAVDGWIQEGFESMITNKMDAKDLPDPDSDFYRCL